MKPYFDHAIQLKNIGITGFQNGVLLYDLETSSFDLLIKFEDLFSLPYSVYLLDEDGATIKINQFGATICGFNAPTKAIGKTIFDVSKGNTSKILLDNCQSVLEQESVKIFDEHNLRSDGLSIQFLSIKYPCYDCKYQLQGTIGISIVVGEHALAEAITRLTDLGLMPKKANANDQAIKLNLGGVLLTPREKQCLEYTVKGFTAKEIAKKLSISPRTVEEYLNQVKLKLDVSTKQLMIQKVLKGHSLK